MNFTHTYYGWVQEDARLIAPYLIKLNSCGMIVKEAYPYLRDRADAGQRLAKELRNYQQEEPLVFAIPRGGVPVAFEVAKALGCRLDIIITRKIPIPSNPEAGYGAVTEDGVIVLNEPLVKSLNYTEVLIKRHAEEIKSEIRRRNSVYRAKLPMLSVEGKTAIIIDDGLASGFTMIAAIKSLRQRKAAKVVVAVPVASAGAWRLIKALADDIISLIIADTHYFAVASFYQHWYNLNDEEVLDLLEEYTKSWSAASR